MYKSKIMKYKEVDRLTTNNGRRGTNGFFYPYEKDFTIYN